MKDYDKNKGPSYLHFREANNLYGWTMSQKLLVEGFRQVQKSSQFSKALIENYNKDSDDRQFLEVYVQYPEKTHDLNNDLPFSLERKNVEKVEKLVANLYVAKSYTHN